MSMPKVTITQTDTYTCEHVSYSEEEHRLIAEHLAAHFYEALRLDEYDVLATQTSGPPDIP
jgi:hypothetical protein